MNIADNTVVEFHYRLSDADGQIETSHDSDPMLYLHGHGNIIPGLEKALLGKTVGDQVQVVLPPEEAYGVPQTDAIQRIPVKHLQGAKKWKPGMVARVQTEQGPRQVTVVKVGLKQADVDTNHPLAGRTLTFDVEIVSVRAAEKEEIAHKHAHGKGGHHH